ncbi:hypothetical protein HYV30_00630 [Candidatus Kaiserbacteria bacterium]|nr:hypothetical protein [Candidatus Kaiserbacteria bacterium]
MNESPPNENAEERRLVQAGLELQRQDKEDPERAPIVRIAHKVAMEVYRGNEALLRDIESFRRDFLEHFGKSEGQKYRLYHALSGSTPLGSAIYFDAEGEWSIEAKARELAERYHIDIE